MVMRDGEMERETEVVLLRAPPPSLHLKTDDETEAQVYLA